MSTEDNNQDGTPAVNEGGEVATPTPEQISEWQSQAEKAAELEKELGSLKRDFKKATKQLEDKQKPAKDDDSPQKQPQPNNLDYGELAFHNTKQDSVKIEHAEDIDFLKETMESSGKSQSDILNSNWFKSELMERQTARATQSAVPKGGNRSGESGVSDTDLAIAKYQETGEIPQDFETRKQVFGKLAEAEKTGNVFSGPSVIGPRPQRH